MALRSIAFSMKKTKKSTMKFNNIQTYQLLNKCQLTHAKPCILPTYFSTDNISLDVTLITTHEYLRGKNNENT